MRIIKRKTLREQWAKHPDAEPALREWIRDVESVVWEHADDVRRRYPNVRAIPDSRFVFDIKGNHYRLIVHVFFPANVVYVKWFGTHAEYDDIDPVEVDEF